MTVGELAADAVLLASRARATGTGGGAVFWHLRRWRTAIVGVGWG
jgi:hypothetical protein